MNESLHLGPFEVQERVGEGGMGVVHRGAHRETGEPVALKLSTTDVAQPTGGRERFRREARALAKLFHPVIAAILDYGEVDASTAADGPASWVEGAPWFAMEYVEGRPLEAAVSDWGWSRLESFLVSILDALSHAHARSVVHRDLKPGNILVDVEGGRADIQTKLVDFGVARIFDRRPDASEDPDNVIGTPKYMAPEQIRGDWRDQGPATDLYALGCLTWRIVCGTVPFDGETTEETLENHLAADLPPFEPRMPVPEGFENWLRDLLHNDPDRRTNRAADAARTLFELDRDRRMTPMGGFSAVRNEEGAIRVHSTLGGLADTVADGEASTGVANRNDGSDRTITRPQAAVDADAPSAAEPPDAPPVPPDWRREPRDRSAAVLPEAGLELFGLREIPVVDRESEREQLWRALRRVADDRHPRLVTLEGGPGTGKSRLAEWLGRRAEELGAATHLKGTHTEASEPDEGLRDLFRRVFETTGLDRMQVFERVLEQLPSIGRHDSMQLNDARGLTELLRPTPDDAEEVDGPPYRFSAPSQKYALVRRGLQRLATRRRLVVWFDDLHWGRESLGALESLFRPAVGELPILAVATIRTDVVSEDPRLATRLDELFEAAEAERIELSALDPDGQRALIDRLLDLDPELAQTLATRTEGHPLFAIQLLQGWVDRGLLQSGDRGFRFRDNADVEIPSDVRKIWLDRLRHLVSSVPSTAPDDVWRALEWAAVLGREISSHEWEALSRELDLSDGHVIRVLLFERGLAEETDQGWTFTHGLLVETLVHRAQAQGRWRSLHARSARLLDQLDSGPATNTAARRADHWETAREWERAIDALFEEYERLTRIGANKRALDVLSRRAQLLDRLSASEDDPRRIEQDIARGLSGLRAGVLPADEALDLVDSAEQRSLGRDRFDLAAKARTGASNCHRRLGDYGAARDRAREAVDAARNAEDSLELVRAMANLAWNERACGELDRARTHGSTALDHARDIGARHEALRLLHHLAFVALTAGNLDRARRLYEQLDDQVRDRGYRKYVGWALNGLGEIARIEGDADRAREQYRELLDLSREMSHRPGVAICFENLAEIELMDRQFEEALDAIDRAEQRLDVIGQPDLHAPLFDLLRATRAAGVDDWTAFDTHLDPYLEGWPEDERLIADHPWLLEMAGRFALESGAEKRAERAWRLARDLYRDLDDESSAEAIEDRLDRLD